MKILQKTTIDYEVQIHTYPPTLSAVLSHRVSQRGVYEPSSILLERINSLYPKRVPRVIGNVTERIALEMLDGGKIIMEDQLWHLKCDKLRNLMQRLDWDWRPGFGMYCDDIGTIASDSVRQLLFITECKGTTCEHGLSADAEAKMFYQLARTYEKASRTRKLYNPSELGGVIAVLVNHFLRVVTININDRTSSFAGGLPDSWMYSERKATRF